MPDRNDGIDDLGAGCAVVIVVVGLVVASALVWFFR